MDNFGYFAANYAARNGYNAPVQNSAVRNNGISPFRDELNMLLRRLRSRYGRRRVFRTTDVENVIRELRWPHELPLEMQTPPRIVYGDAIVTPVRPVVDLTEPDVVIE